MKILVLDNYDSFTYNLVHILVQLGYGNSTDVIRNDKLTVKDAGKYDKILLSPGPGIPDEAGCMKDIIKEYGKSLDILGVCLGHQGIAEVYGAQLYNLQEVLHGIKSRVSINDTDEILFKGLPQEFDICHYHSWAVDAQSLPKDLVVTARDPRGIIMGIRHKEHNVRGVQFHPESIMTEYGVEIINNWLTN